MPVPLSAWRRISGVDIGVEIEAGDGERYFGGWKTCFMGWWWIGNDGGGGGGGGGRGAGAGAGVYNAFIYKCNHKDSIHIKNSDLFNINWEFLPLIIVDFFSIC